MIETILIAVLLVYIFRPRYYFRQSLFSRLFMPFWGIGRGFGRMYRGHMPPPPPPPYMGGMRGRFR